MNDTPSNKEAQGRYPFDQTVEITHEDGEVLIQVFVKDGGISGRGVWRRLGLPESHYHSLCYAILNSHPAGSAERERLITEVSEFLEFHPTGPTDNEKRRWAQLAEGYLHNFLDHLRGNENG
jgi:hypothetical protein